MIAKGEQELVNKSLMVVSSFQQSCRALIDLKIYERVKFGVGVKNEALIAPNATNSQNDQLAN